VCEDVGRKNAAYEYETGDERTVLPSSSMNGKYNSENLTMLKSEC